MIAFEVQVVQPLLLWESYTLIDSLGHTDLFVSVLFTAIYCFSLLSARVMLQRASSRFHHLIRIDRICTYGCLLIARPRIIPMSSESDTVGGR